jgi:hypothetical protein
MAGGYAKCPKCSSRVTVPWPEGTANELASPASSPPDIAQKPAPSVERDAAPPEVKSAATSRLQLKEFFVNYWADISGKDFHPGEPFHCPRCRSEQRAERFFASRKMRILLIISFIHPVIGLLFWLLARRMIRCGGCGKSSFASVIEGKRPTLASMLMPVIGNSKLKRKLFLPVLISGIIIFAAGSVLLFLHIANPSPPGISVYVVSEREDGMYDFEDVHRIGVFGVDWSEDYVLGWSVFLMILGPIVFALSFRLRKAGYPGKV